MKISREAKRSARELFQLSVAGGQLDPARVREISGRLLESKPRGYFQILKEFTRLVRLELGKRHAVVESAFELIPFNQQALISAIGNKFGRDVTVEFQVEPSLIGGLRIKVGSDVWDGSLRTRLSEVAKELL